MDTIYILISIAVLVIICSIIWTIIRRRSCKKVIYLMTVLSGKVMEITKDNESGLSRITMKNLDGQICYGFSTLSVSELIAIYSDLEYTEIPVITAKTVTSQIM